MDKARKREAEEEDPRRRTRRSITREVYLEMIPTSMTRGREEREQVNKQLFKSRQLLIIRPFWSVKYV